MPSLRDVATHAGVSVATASRVASGSDMVRPETRERVERAMRELLYVPRGREDEEIDRTRRPPEGWRVLGSRESAQREQ